ncbi:expressed protein [Phakopsora pachyrhizi]|uniref:Expressed protein n=1 Tax=Phakopsora pachyrhizi TaxID=170000 RepID=A0AAV0AGI8_PHAPC|nr:expressed protein [Phakopsora pachyrhizi]
MEDNCVGMSDIRVLRSRYHSTVRSFLLNRHQSVWKNLESISTSITSNQQQQHQHQHPWWTSSSSTKSDHYQLNSLDSKLKILRITFLTSLNNQPNSLKNKLPSDLRQLINRPSDKLIITILNSFTASDSADLTSKQHDLQLTVPQPSSSLQNLHPSVVNSILLASLKLGCIQLSKSIAEAWLGSLEDQTLNYLERIFAKQQQRDDDDRGLVKLRSDLDNRVDEEGSKELFHSYLLLIEIYSIKILGESEEWELALEFVNGQSNSSGGILPARRVQIIVDSINRHRESKIKYSRLLQQRQREQQARREESARRMKSLSNQSHLDCSSSSSSSLSSSSSNPKRSTVDSSLSSSSLEKQSKQKRQTDQSLGNVHPGLQPHHHTHPGRSNAVKKAGNGEAMEEDQEVENTSGRGFTRIRTELSNYLNPPPPSSSNQSRRRRTRPEKDQILLPNREIQRNGAVAEKLRDRLLKLVKTIFFRLKLSEQGGVAGQRDDPKVKSNTVRVILLIVLKNLLRGINLIVFIRFWILVYSKIYKSKKTFLLFKKIKG